MKIRILKAYPRISAHLICESLGYLTPISAENMIESFIAKEGYCCEWTYSIELRTKESRYSITKSIIQNAISNRHYHKGYMSDYKNANNVIKKELAGNGPLFASWF